MEHWRVRCIAVVLLFLEYTLILLCSQMQTDFRVSWNVLRKQLLGIKSYPSLQVPGSIDRHIATVHCQSVS